MASINWASSFQAFLKSGPGHQVTSPRSINVPFIQVGSLAFLPGAKKPCPRSVGDIDTQVGWGGSADDLRFCLDPLEICDLNRNPTPRNEWSRGLRAPHPCWICFVYMHTLAFRCIYIYNIYIHTKYSREEKTPESVWYSHVRKIEQELAA